MEFEERTGIPGLGAEAELYLKERALDEAPIGITISDATRPDNPLIYANDAFERLTGYPKSEVIGHNCRFLQGPDTDPEPVARMREGIDAAEPVSVELVNYRKDGTRFWNKVDIAPVRDADGTVTNYVGFQTDITARIEAERRARERAAEARRERERLAHLLRRLENLIQDVTAELIRAESRDAAERAVCDRLVALDTYAAAWIGDLDPAGETLTVTHWESTADVGDPVIIDLADAESLRRAVETGEIQITDDPSALASDPLRPPTAVGGAVVPLVYQDTCYGVLTVYTETAEALNEQEGTVLTALGREIGTTINTLENKQLLTSDVVVEVECEIADRSLFLTALAADADCELTYRSSISQDDGSVLMFVSTDGDPETVRIRASEHDAVESVASLGTSTDGDGRSILEFRIRPPSLLTRMAERGARVRRLVADGRTARLGFEVSSQSTAREVVEWLQSEYDGVTLTRYRDDRRPMSRRGFIRELEQRLTQRQLTAVQKAYLNGYYDSTRRVTGDELAESMGISRATFHQHLRAAERKLLEAVVDASGWTPD